VKLKKKIKMKDEYTKLIILNFKDMIVKVMKDWVVSEVFQFYYYFFFQPRNVWQWL